MSKQGMADQAGRLDRWLWCARFFKTRSSATKFVNDGHVRITRDETTSRAEKPSLILRPGDTLIFTRGDQLRVIEVIAGAERRGPASEAQTLYTDHSPPRPTKEERKAQPFEREKGAGRPTKKDRRALDAIKIT